MLCSRFLKLCNNSVSDIKLDAAAQQLGVERRRMYDVCNILESLDFMTKRTKNTYRWNGTRYLHACLAQLQEEAAEIFPSQAKASGIQGIVHGSKKRHQGRDTQGSGGDHGGRGALPSLPYQKERSEKSLATLCRRFVQMFLVGNSQLKVGEASLFLDKHGSGLGDTAQQKHKSKPSSPQSSASEDGGGNKTRLRRLYDVANVLCAVDLIVKVASKSAPSFVWCGPPVTRLQDLALVPATGIRAMAEVTGESARGQEDSTGGEGTPVEALVVVKGSTPHPLGSIACGQCHTPRMGTTDGLSPTTGMGWSSPSLMKALDQEAHLSGRGRATNANDAREPPPARASRRLHVQPTSVPGA
ncbi:unnamed protein product [Chrysoparadoxa australica]